jgi:hypothetical protein
VRGAQLAPSSRDGRRERQLYDLAADPDAAVDVAAVHPEVVRDLEAAIDAHRERERGLTRAATPGVIDAQTRERLRALGYIDDDR